MFDQVNEAVRAARQVRLERMAAAVADAHGVTTEEILGRGRTAVVAAARHELMATLWRSGIPLAEVGRMLGRDHSTIIAGVKHAIGEAAYQREMRMRKSMPIFDLKLALLDVPSDLHVRVV